MSLHQYMALQFEKFSRQFAHHTQEVEQYKDDEISSTIELRGGSSRWESRP
jgi:hypothetical protein